MVYTLLRQPATSLTAASHEVFYLKAGDVTTEYTGHPNFTFVDIPGPAGIYTYQVLVSETLITRTGVSIASAFNLGLTATIYPPA
ncbi:MULTISPECIES: hypothetical protein [Bacillus cereus group]|uniref:Uncharacterized protein n=1 Tax=Bacillus proteolyticus TaxID=2026192 RepID=A0ABV3IAQ3_9BACI|nr:hypothetical protein [Bacillus cereus group sp. N8]MBJ8106025.1 hypothetical protein [Bacillus cereus group sp. N8]